MRPSRVTLVILVALLGVACAAGITYAGSRLVSQPIGLSSEPRDLSRSLTPLVPAKRATPATTTTTKRTRTTPKATSTTPPAVAPATTLATPAQPSTNTATAPTHTATSPSAVDDHGGSRQHDSDGDYDD